MARVVTFRGLAIATLFVLLCLETWAANVHMRAKEQCREQLRSVQAGWKRDQNDHYQREWNAYGEVGFTDGKLRIDSRDESDAGIYFEISLTRDEAHYLGIQMVRWSKSTVM